MRLSDLPSGFDWEKAFPLRPPVSKRELQEVKIPEAGGVYVVFSTKPVCRLKGQSQIILIGSTKKRDGLLGRLSQLLSGSKSGHTAKWRIRRIVKHRQLKVVWRKVPDAARAVEMEKQLLRAYVEDHLELPPANHSIPGGDSFEV